MSAAKDQLVLSSQLTTTPGADVLSPFQEGSDYLVRFMTDETRSLHSFVASTSDVQTKLASWASVIYRDIEQLKEVVQWQHKTIDYNSLYQAFLLDQLSESEFEYEAEKFAYEPVQMAPEDLASKVQRVYSLTGIHYTPSEISDLFQCNHEEAMQAISIIRVLNPELSYMLPEGDR